MTVTVEERPRRIAVLVHNDVVRDARVLKEVATLGAAGYVVDVVGATTKPGTYPATVPGARTLRIMDISPKSLQGKFFNLADRYYPIVLDYLLVLLGVLPMFFMLSWSQSLSDSALAFTILSPMTLLGLLAMKKNTKIRRWTQYGLFGLFAVLLTLALGYSVQLGRVGPIGFLVLVSLLYFIVRLDIRPRHILFAVLERLRGHRVVSYRKERYQAIALQLAKAVDPAVHEVVHCHDIIALIAGTHLKRKHPRMRLIWDAHEFYEEVASGTAEDKDLVREVIRDAEGRVDAFVTISDSFREIYARDYPKLPPALVVMNATRNAGAVVDDGRLHRAAGLSPDRRIVLFQGGFAPHRGINHLLEAAKTLPAPWSIVMMGWGKLEPEIAAAIEELVDPDHPEAAPLAMIPGAPQDELPLWSAGAALGIIPYENTGLNHLYCTPNKLWEFPNAGVPILATSLIEMERIIGTWKTGFLLPRDFGPQEIVGALARITEAELETAKANCRVFSDAMSWDRFEDELLKAYAA